MEQEVQFRFENIKDLKLDQLNPRFPERIKGATDNEIINWMLSDATLIDLMASIAENGFFSGEPIIVIESKGKFIVIEGNRRLAAIKLLMQPTIAKVSPQTVSEISKLAISKNNIPNKIWVYVVKTRIEVENYLGYRHVSGIREWPTLSKAKYLNQLYIDKKNKNVSVYKELAKEIGSKASYVRRLLIGYQAFEIIKNHNYYNIEDIDEESFDLSLITDAITMHSGIINYVGINLESKKPFQKVKPDRFKELTKWLYEKLNNGKTKLGESRNLKLLSRILSNNQAREAFIKGDKSLVESAELTDIADDNIRLYLNKASQNLSDAQKIAHRSKKPDLNDITLVEDIINSSELIKTILSKKLK